MEHFIFFKFQSMATKLTFLPEKFSVFIFQGINFKPQRDISQCQCKIENPQIKLLGSTKIK